MDSPNVDMFEEVMVIADLLLIEGEFQGIVVDLTDDVVGFLPFCLGIFCMDINRLYI